VIYTRYKKLKGMRAGHAYVTVGLNSEVEVPIRWTLCCVTDEFDFQIVSEDDLYDPKLWQPFP
jgi:hypothetical protein